MAKKEIAKDKKVAAKKVEKKEESTLKSVLELIAIIIAIIVILVFFPNTPIANIVTLLLMLSLLIFVHEGGHFIMAKTFKVHVYEFALGMGPKILGFKRKNDPTEYTLRAFPIGGYCAMAGEEGEDDKSLTKDKFMCNKPKYQRFLILVAGVTMNFILAFILLFFIALVWGSPNQESIIENVTANSPASEAGIVKGDTIIEVNGRKVKTWDDISLITALKNKNKYYEYKIKHEDGTIETFKIIPDDYAVIKDKEIKIDEENTKEKIKKEYKVKELTTRKVIGIKANSKKCKGFSHSIKYAYVKFKSLSTMMVKIVWYLITGQLGLNNLSGPVGMYSIVGDAAKYGIANIIYLAAYLSINLGVINILPFPAFDGGRAVFVLIEAITRKKVDPKVEAMFHTVGFVLLMTLMLYITLQDIIKII